MEKLAAETEKQKVNKLDLENGMEMIQMHAELNGMENKIFSNKKFIVAMFPQMKKVFDAMNAAKEEESDSS